MRPWWEKVEDYCVYGLLVVGVILVPNAIILGTPLYCDRCQVLTILSKSKETAQLAGSTKSIHRSDKLHQNTTTFEHF